MQAVLNAQRYLCPVEGWGREERASKRRGRVSRRTWTGWWEGA